MSEAMGKAEVGATGAVTGEVQKQSIMAAISKLLTWSPTSREDIIKSEKELLTLVKTPYVVEQVNIGAGPPGSKVSWFRSVSNEPRFINTVTFDKPDAPTIVLVHGYAASQGFFFRNFDALASKFRVIAIDQIGWGASSRPDFTCKNTEEAESWFVESLEEWRKAKQLDDFILLGHSLGGYVASRYALKYPDHVKHLVLVGPAGFNVDSDRIMKFKSTWPGVLINCLWESNFTPQKIIRGLGPWGPKLVNGYAVRRFGNSEQRDPLSDAETKLLSNYIFHTAAAKASGELCLNYIFSFGALARTPLVDSAPNWKVPTSFIYGTHDWMNFEGAKEARKRLVSNIPCEILRVPKAGHFVFLDNAPKFHDALFYACRNYLPGGSRFELPEEILEV
jgi:pimeloyl-ACP methyl ester carboxylesterase